MPVDEWIPTPTGFKRNGDLQFGDKVFGEHGQICQVLIAHPIVECQLYKVSFDDGTFTYTHDDHLWLTFTHADRKALQRCTEEYRARRRAQRPSRSRGIHKQYGRTLTGAMILPVRTGSVKTTAEIRATLTAGSPIQTNHTIPLAQPIDLPIKNLPLDPYVLGAWLGDGTQSKSDYGMLTCSEVDEGEILIHFISAGFMPHKRKAKYAWYINGLPSFLKGMNLIENKHIPDEYLWASREQRLALLQGLMDTDGTCQEDRSVSFSNTNENLARGVYHLAASLGVKPYWAERRARLKGKDCGPYYQVSWTATLPCFRLKRKLNHIPVVTRATQQWRYIVNVEPAMYGFARCITTDNPSGLYLFGKNFNITHNSWSIARVLLKRALIRKERIGCFRELQASIKDSVHQVLRDQIFMLGMTNYFRITESSIVCRTTGSEFLFKGLRHNVVEIKSTEGITIAWVEEAQLVSKDSWNILIPTIRVEGSEIWVSFNPIEEGDPTYQQFIVKPPPESLILKVSWRDNPYFTKTQDADRRWMLANDPDTYDHVWEGECQKLSDDVIFRNRWVVEAFNPPHYPQEPDFLFGADFGFANDPSTLVRMWITGDPPDEELWIDHEAWKIGCEIDDMPKLYDFVPGSRRWPIKADEARPETISYIRRQGFNITPAEKWPGCVEDRIAHIKGYKKIHIHDRCKNTQFEARNYRYKRDRVTGEVLPVVIDKNNHIWDAVGYGLDGRIQRRGVAGVWAKL